MNWKKETEEIQSRRQLAKEQGGADAVARQHEKGRLTIRERINELVDEDSFREFGEGAGLATYDEAGQLASFDPANFVLGMAKLDGRRVVVGGENFTLKGGSPNQAGLRKSIYAEDLALQYKVPLVRLHEGAGGSVAGADGKGQSAGDPVYQPPRFRSIIELLGSVPVASAALGPVAGLPAARLVSSHFSVMCETAQVMVAGPAVVERALGQKLSKEELGGSQIHAKSGVVDNIAKDEKQALTQIKQFLSYLPANVWEMPPRVQNSDSSDRPETSLINAVPKDRRKPFQIRKIIEAVSDEQSFFEMTPTFGRGQVTGLA